MYEALSDNDIVKAAQSGDGDATDFLLRKYGKLAKRESRTWFLVGGDEDDVSQEGMIGLLKAIREYDDKRDASFPTFAVLCIRSQIKTAIKQSNRKKNLPLNEYISIYGDDDGEGSRQAEADTPDFSFEPERMILEQEQLEGFYRRLNIKLTSFEKSVLDLFLEGLSYQDIASKLNKDKKSIDNALKRIRNKLKTE
ncbi:MAG: sigma-70 family RNA polymerase sigma factor [Lachnospiraceae bacterium]|nr:sigma-70 family RNA polymerase sigma factor [Lachnospiraceae bacterium]